MHMIAGHRCALCPTSDNICKCWAPCLLPYRRTIFLIFLKFTVGPVITFQSFANNARIVFAIQFVGLTIAPLLPKRWIIYGKARIHRLFIGIKSDVQTIRLWFNGLGNHRTKMLQSASEHNPGEREKGYKIPLNWDARELWLLFELISFGKGEQIA